MNGLFAEPECVRTIIEWEWLSNVGITHFEGDFTFDLFFFVFLLGSCLLAQQVNFKQGFQLDSFTKSFHFLGITQLQGEFIQAAPNCADSGALQILSIGYRLLTLWSSVSFKTNPLTAVKDVSGSPRDPYKFLVCATFVKGGEQGIYANSKVLILLLWPRLVTTYCSGISSLVLKWWLGREWGGWDVLKVRTYRGLALLRGTQKHKLSEMRVRHISTRIRVERQVLWSSVMQQHVAKVLPSFHDEKARKVSSGKYWHGETGSPDGKTAHNSGASCVAFLSVHVRAFCWKPFVLCATKWVQENISILMFFSLTRKKNACRSGGELSHFWHLYQQSILLSI